MIGELSPRMTARARILALEQRRQAPVRIPFEGVRPNARDVRCTTSPDAVYL